MISNNQSHSMFKYIYGILSTTISYSTDGRVGWVTCKTERMGLKKPIFTVTLLFLKLLGVKKDF